MSSTVILILLCFYVSFGVIDGKLGLQFLGLFTTTNCTKENEFDCHNAKINQETMLLVHQHQQFWFDVHLCFKDIGNNTRTLVNTVFPLTTDERDTYQVKCENRNGSWDLDISKKRLLILTYLSFDLTRLLSALLLPQDLTMLISITDRPMYPAAYIEDPRAIYSFEAGFGVQMHQEFNKIKKKLNVTYGAFFNLGSGERNTTVSTEELCKTKPMASAMCIYINLNPTDCYKEISIDVSNETEVNQVMKLAKSVNQSFIFEAGDSRSISTFQRTVNAHSEKMGDIFYLPFLTQLKDLKSVATEVDPLDIEYDDGDVLTNFQGYLAVNGFLFFAFDLPTELLKEVKSENKIKTIWTRLLKNENAQKLLKRKFKESFESFNSTITIDMLKFLQSFGKLEKALESLMAHEDATLLLVDFWKKTYYIENVSEEKLLDQWSFNPTKALKA
uniref:Cnidarian restricted protein n=1 Tax=Clytia hemisphaerica TaxID=252671 RepID=A0A7M5XMI6_9CNID